MTYPARMDETGSQQPDAGVEALMATSKVLTAVVSRSLMATGASVTTSQLRVLVMLSSRGPLNLSAVAEGLGVNASNASRTCDQLVDGKLVNRRVDTQDRRSIVLSLSKKGAALVERLMAERRAVFTSIAASMSPRDQAALTRGLSAFLRAADAASEVDGTRNDDHPLRWLT